jgi:hypothetical protein
MGTTSFGYSSAMAAHFTYFAIAIAATVVFVAIYVAAAMTE